MIILLLLLASVSGLSYYEGVSVVKIGMGAWMDSFEFETRDTKGGYQSPVKGGPGGTMKSFKVPTDDCVTRIYWDCQSASRNCDAPGGDGLTSFHMYTKQVRDLLFQFVYFI
jgi:hypothetical protein